MQNLGLNDVKEIILLDDETDFKFHNKLDASESRCYKFHYIDTYKDKIYVLLYTK